MQMNVFGTVIMREVLVTRLELGENPPSPCILEKLSELGLTQQLLPAYPFDTYTPKASFPMTHTWQLVHLFYY